MSKVFVAVSIEKVQAFIYEVVTAHEQEKQKEKHTLRSIMDASAEISDNFVPIVKSLFTDGKIERCIEHSGEIMFVYEDDSVNCENSLKLNTEATINRLFLYYYKKYKGQVLPRMAIFPYRNNFENCFWTAKHHLKANISLREATLRNQACLFSIDSFKNKFSDVSELPFASVEKKVYDPKDYPRFVKEINDLYQPTSPEKEEEKDDPPFRVAVIKADVDGMGNMFSAIGNILDYIQISKIFKDNICLDTLHFVAENICNDNDKDFRIFPIYAAGDDIFFIVAVKHLIKGVEVCRKLINKLKKELKTFNDSIYQKISSHLTLSIGVEINFNTQPIRFYYERVEEGQVQTAKKANVKEKVLEEFLNAKICIDGYTFFDFDEYNEDNDEDKRKAEKTARENRKKAAENVKKAHKNNGTPMLPSEEKELNEAIAEYDDIDIGYKNTPVWVHFLHDVKSMKQLNPEGYSVGAHQYSSEGKVGSHGFFYKLLSILSDPDIIKYEERTCNALLYHLMPQHLDRTNAEKSIPELVLLTTLVSLLYTKNKKDKKYAISFKEAAILRLKKYAELMLLFSDPRFNIQCLGDSIAISKKTYQTEYKKETQSRLFNTPLRYLFDKHLSTVPQNGHVRRVDPVRDKFVKDTSFRSDIGKGNHRDKNKVQYYQTLEVEKSMLFRLIRLIGNENDKERKAKVIEHWAAILDDQNKTLKTDINIGNKPVSHFPFEKENFIEQFNDKTPDVLDREYLESLMLFYEYNDLLIRFKTLFGDAEKN